MQRYYYNQLGKEEKKKILEKYRKDYADSEFQKRLIRLAVYSIVGFLFSAFLVIYSLTQKEDLLSNLLIAIPLFIISIVFLIGRYYAKLKILNKIALKEKN